ncbi:MAG: PSD1 domain-containing protein [Planctomycetales bacterium]|nr:PSD1 domain-containing protein [Planctomycetales bacterium]
MKHFSRLLLQLGLPIITLLQSQTLLSQVVAPAEDKQIEFFEQKVRPLLVEHCWNCHGQEKQWNGLRLDSYEALRKGGDSGSAVVPGDSQASLLLRAVRREDGLEMPPDSPLSELQIATLQMWIERGAFWPEPTSPINGLTNENWKSHWAFQPLAPSLPDLSVDQLDASKWCRNPIDQFVFQRLLQAGLAPSPEADRATLARRLFFVLTGLPPTYDQIQEFVTDSQPDAYESLVDDLLDSPRFGEHLARQWLDVARYSDSKGYVYAREERFFVNSFLYRDWVINAFNEDLPYDRFVTLQLAADRWTHEDRRNLAAMGFLTLGRRFLGVTHDIIDDRIDVVGRGLMGLTLSCARCHDHKYDPIPTSDYYAWYGIFKSCTDRQVDLSEELGFESNSEFSGELKKRLTVLEEKTLHSRETAAEQVRKRIADYLYAQTELEKYGQEGFDVILSTQDLIPAFVRRWEAYLSQFDSQDPIFGPWIEFNLHANRSAELDELKSAETERRTVRKYHPWLEQALSPAPASARELADRYGQLFGQIDKRWREIRDENQDQRSEIDRNWLVQAEPFLAVMYGSTAPCEVPNEEIIATETYFDTKTCEQLWKLQGEVDRWRIQASQPPPVAVGVFDRPVAFEANVFYRGNPANKGPRVSRHFLSLFDGPSPTPFAEGSGRWELADRIVDPKNPLTPRVWVNRLWQHCFGQGLVSTPSDFGMRASAPTHPELLDWLAHRLIRSGWSTKQVLRSMLLSATFRQSSSANLHRDGSVCQQSDPDNHWLWRMNVRRQSFEELRDSLLSISTDLDQRAGGKPLNLFDADDGNHRRTIYAQVDRQFLPSTLRVFDFANPDLHIGRRSETLVPQQSLFFLNHPFVARRATRAVQELLGENIPDEVDNTHVKQHVTALYRKILQRDPNHVELAGAVAFLEQPQLDSLPQPSATSLDWSYGFGEVDQHTGRVTSFQALPYFTGDAWQGGVKLPDGKLGWVQLTARGGHPGNDLQHACIRRWIAPRSMTVTVESVAQHEPDVSDGIRLRIISSRHGTLTEEHLRSSKASMAVERVELQPGDTIDFVVDIIQELNSDQFLWSPVIREQNEIDSQSNLTDWDASRDFQGPVAQPLSQLEQLAQILMLTNEFQFID